MHEVQVQFLGQGNALEKEMAPILVFFSRKSHGQRSLVVCSPWGHRESDKTEVT